MNIREKTAVIVQRNLNIDPSVTEALFDIGLIREDVAKKFVIREEYFDRSHTHKKTDLKIALAEKYNVSLSTIEKTVTETTM